MNNLLLIYNFIISSLLGITGFTTATNSQEMAFAALFIPLSMYFLSKIIRQKVTTANLKRLKRSEYLATAPNTKIALASDAIEGEVIDDPSINDVNKRLFLKLIGSGGITLFLMSLFTKKSHAAFFGSVPGPGVVAIKDSSGTQIDPAEKQPTDGYEISELDETDTTYSYYGFVHKDGPWYIARETKDSGSYRYASGASSFSSAWTARDDGFTHTYDYFDATF